MKISKTKAEYWQYSPSKKDNHLKAEFYGWSTRPKSYYHVRCQNYFTKKYEKHRCIHWEFKHAKRKYQ